VGSVGDHARALARIWKTSLRSALPVRTSYNVKVRSDPVDARTEASDKLNLRAVIVSVDVGKVRFMIAEDLRRTRHVNVMAKTGIYKDGRESSYFVSSQIWTIFEAVANIGSVRW